MNKYYLKMQMMPSEQEIIEADTSALTEIDIINRVILFNDEEHDFDEVIEQIIKAINCTYERAEQLTLEVHNTGQAVVFEGKLEECIRVSSVLEEINLRTQIEF